MYAVKESSTNQLNKTTALSDCPVTYTLHRIGGRWKVLIIHQLATGPMRYGELKKAIPAITEKMLIQHLKELEADDLVIREVKPVVPPHVTYSLSTSGTALKPVLKAMAEWGLTFTRKDGVQAAV
jgi:DNA-binding HxlR family transcriptional regulator